MIPMTVPKIPKSGATVIFAHPLDLLLRAHFQGTGERITTVGNAPHEHSHDVILGLLSELPGRSVILFFGQLQDPAHQGSIPVPRKAKPKQGPFEDDGQGDNGADEQGVHDGPPLKEEVEHSGPP